MTVSDLSGRIEVWSTEHELFDDTLTDRAEEARVSGKQKGFK